MHQSPIDLNLEVSSDTRVLDLREANVLSEIIARSQTWKMIKTSIHIKSYGSRPSSVDHEATMKHRSVKLKVARWSDKMWQVSIGHRYNLIHLDTTYWPLVLPWTAWIWNGMAWISNGFWHWLAESCRTSPCQDTWPWLAQWRPCCVGHSLSLRSIVSPELGVNSS